MEYGTVYTCTECRAEHKFHTMRECENGRRMIKDKICFKCSHWIGLIEDQTIENRTVVDGRHYIACPKGTVDQYGFRGFGGHNFKIAYFDGRLIESDNVWHQGEIPERFRDRLPDNARFIR